MSRFINNAVSDIRGGRESWRVVLFLTVPVFLVTIVSVGAISRSPW